jgi:hypothetical protein
METIVIVLCILVGIAIVALGSVSFMQVLTGSKERRELQRLLKARDLPEYTQYTNQEEEIIDEDQNLVELENIDTVIQEALEKNAKFEDRGQLK